MAALVPPPRRVRIACEPAVAHQQVLVAQVRGQFSAAHQRHADSHSRPPFFARCQPARTGEVVLLDYLDPAGDLIAGERLPRAPGDRSGCVPRSESTTSSSVSPRAINPHSHLICLDMFLVAAIVGSRSFLISWQQPWRKVGKISLPSGYRQGSSSAVGSSSNSHGRRIDPKLPSRQGRLLFAYLALNRERALTP